MIPSIVQLHQDKKNPHTFTHRQCSMFEMHEAKPTFVSRSQSSWRLRQERCGGDGNNVDEMPRAAKTHPRTTAKGNDPGNGGKKRVVAAPKHPRARAEMGPTLPNDNRARLCKLSMRKLDSQALSVGIATEGCRTSGFFMRHREEKTVLGKILYAFLFRVKKKMPADSERHRMTQDTQARRLMPCRGRARWRADTSPSRDRRRLQPTRPLPPTLGHHGSPV